MYLNEAREQEPVILFLGVAFDWLQPLCPFSPRMAAMKDKSALTLQKYTWIAGYQYSLNHINSA